LSYLSVTGILNRVREEDLYYRYCGVDVNNPIKVNPTRTEGACSLKVHKVVDRIRWSDFGQGIYNADVFDMIQLVKGWSFYETLIRINTDYNLGFDYSKKYQVDISMDNIPLSNDYIIDKYKGDDSSVIDVVLNKYNNVHVYPKDDLRYWSTGCITKRELQREKVYSISVVLLNGTPIWHYHKKNPIFLYLETNLQGRWKKLYKPLETNKKNKWLSNIKYGNDFLYGYGKELDADYLIITKSKKDYMVLYYILGLNTKYIQSESVIPTDRIIDEVWKKYQRIYILFDNDESGVGASTNLAQITEWIPIQYPLDLGIKDTFECVVKYGLDKTVEILTQLL